MALEPTPIAVTGGEHTAQMFRMMVRDLSRANEGITEGDHLKVTALSTPGAGVQVADGSATIIGRVSPVQGSYNTYNIGAATVSISATGGTTRSDMLVLRVEDPEYEGSRDPSNCAYFDVISNVSSSATTVPAGYSAIPLARIDIPSSTATITSAMIVDLRRVANPRRERILYPYYAQDPLVEISGTSETWKSFPNLTMATIAIPVWAASAKVIFSGSNIRLDDGNVWGGFRFMLGGIEAAQWVNIDDNQGSAPRRTYCEMVETIDLTTTAGAALRGTNAAFISRMRTRSANAGSIGVDATTTFKIDIEFTEGRL
ncbi:hypothetical protein ACFYXD_35040 [Streptomyces platensis]|uniref:hypothetical protein n=1 Tax=Streptomyces platensis TaxID=58346 RepID=UPI0036B428AA